MKGNLTIDGIGAREFFAASSMQAAKQAWPNQTPEFIARVCFELADAMLAESLKPIKTRQENSEPKEVLNQL